LDCIQVATAEGVEDGKQGDAQIECPLCHTKFSLENGKVAEYCPRDGPLAIGTLKSKEPPVDAKARQSPLFIFIFFLHVLMCSR
jgi:nitrite reductase/ring-hydroxylating ferredoxin subunit